MSRSRAQELHRVDTEDYSTPPRHFTRYPPTASSTRHGRYPVSPSRPSWSASPPIRNERAIQTVDVPLPVSVNVDLVTDYNTLMNCYIPPPAWATTDYHEIRRAPAARRFITGSNSPADHSHHLYRMPHPVVSEIEDGSEEDDAREPWRDAATAATSSSPRRPRKGLKKWLHRFFGKLKRKRSSGRLRPTTTYLPTVPVPVATTSAFTVSSAPRSAYDSVQYRPHDRLNTGAFILDRTYTFQQHMPPCHPLTTATEQAAARVQMAMQTDSSGLELLMSSTRRARRIYDRQDGIIVELTRT